MNSEDFVEAVKRHVRDVAIEGEIANLKSPPGRGVLPEERARSEWYNAPSAKEAYYVNRVIASAVHHALFRLFVVLDGDTLIDEERGVFELTYVTDRSVLLNDPETIGLARSAKRIKLRVCTPQCRKSLWK